jgi:DtxR family Mn-dependent transcriptional regulator
MLSFTEENYLKAIYHLSNDGSQGVTTNMIADHLSMRAASVTDMIKKLATKEVVNHEKYRGVNITPIGKKKALNIIRKHRLWEVFLVDKLKFQWDEVHDIAEELEHIKSDLLIKRLDEYLDYPRVDPHGDPIPDEHGQLTIAKQVPLGESKLHQIAQVVAVDNSDAQFLKHLDRIGIYLGAKIKVLEVVEFDGSIEIEIDNRPAIFVSKQTADNILVTEK